MFTNIGLLDSSRRFQHQVELHFRVGLLAVEDRRDLARDSRRSSCRSARRRRTRRPGCPCSPLRAVTGTPRGPKIRSKARASARSETLVAEPWALTWPTSAGVEPGLLERGRDRDLGAAALRVEPAGRHGVAAGTTAQDLAVDPAPRGSGRAVPSSRIRMPAPSPGTQPSRRRSNGRHAWHGSPFQRDMFSSNAIRTTLKRMNLGIGTAGDHHVGPPARDDPRRLGDRQVGRGIGLGDRVATAPGSRSGSRCGRPACWAGT